MESTLVCYCFLSHSHGQILKGFYIAILRYLNGTTEYSVCYMFQPSRYQPQKSAVINLMNTERQGQLIERFVGALNDNRP